MVDPNDVSARSAGPRVVLAEDDEAVRETLRLVLEQGGYRVAGARDGQEALALLGEDTDVVLTDLQMPELDGIGLVRAGRALAPHAVFICMTAHGAIDSAVAAIQAGAEQYLLKPLELVALDPLLRAAAQRAEQHRALQALRGDRARERAARTILGQHPLVLQLLRTVAQVAPTRATVLITGESGTGKELIARAVHDQSGRPGRFVALNCAALSESVLESELFGHERGAFTGAVGRREGRFKEADAGTLFLDEVSEIPLGVQVKLLRFLQERSFERVGSNKTETVDVRIVAATNRELTAQIEAGRFREDLYYRLSVIDLDVPPLRARASDIEELAEFFIRQACVENQRADVPKLSAAALERLQRHAFPGNVRELQNAMYRASVLCTGTEVLVEHLPRRIPVELGRAQGALDLTQYTLAELERLAIEQALECCNGSAVKAAERLGISARTVQYRIKEWGLREPGEPPSS